MMAGFDPEILEKAFASAAERGARRVPFAADRRRQQRYRISMWAASLTLLREEEQEVCRLLNLSASGMCFRTHVPVQEGDECRLWLILAEPTLGPVLARVQARWVRRLEHDYTDIGASVLESNRDWLGPLEIRSGSSSLNQQQEKQVENHLKHDRELAGQRLTELLSTEHWLGDFISALLSSHELDSGIDFATAEKLLATEKEELEKDLATARRMLRLYPKLLAGEDAGVGGSQAGAGGGV